MALLVGFLIKNTEYLIVTVSIHNTLSMLSSGLTRPCLRHHASSLWKRRDFFAMGIGKTRFNASMVMGSYEKIKIGVVGAGAVGVGVCHNIINLGGCQELVLIDQNVAKAEGEIFDFNHTQALTFTKNMKLKKLVFSPQRLKI